MGFERFCLPFGKIELEQPAKRAIGAALADLLHWMHFSMALGVLDLVAQAMTNRTYVLEAPENRI